MTHEEAIEAGMLNAGGKVLYVSGPPEAGEAALKFFQMLWNKLNPKHPWESNPWVFLGQMERVGT